MPRQTTEEEEEEDDPLLLATMLTLPLSSVTHFEVVDEGVSERVGVQTVHEDGRRDVGKTGENDDTSQEDLPRLEVEQIKLIGEQTDKRPIEQGEGQSTSNSVVAIVSKRIAFRTHDEM